MFLVSIVVVSFILSLSSCNAFKCMVSHRRPKYMPSSLVVKDSIMHRCSTYRMKTSIDANNRGNTDDDDDDDDDIEPIASPYPVHLLSSKEVLRLSGEYNKIIDIFTGNNNVLTDAQLTNWEKDVERLIEDVKKVIEKDILLALYQLILSKVAPVDQLHPLQWTTYQLCVNIISENLLSSIDKDAPVTQVIEDITQLHLNYIEKFRFEINDGGDDGYSQSATQEYICYQFAGLVQVIYDRISKSMGGTYDTSEGTRDLRLTNWVSPVYARLQRRFVRFLSSNVDDKLEEITAESFDTFLYSIKFDEITPSYSLRNKETSVSSLPPTSSSYAAWTLTSFVIKTLRNTVLQKELLKLDTKIAARYQSDLSSRMRPLAKPLENIIYDNNGLIEHNSQELKLVEDMLNIGHACVSAVFTLWNIRYNIIGVQDKDDPANYIKDYIKPVVLSSKESALESIPKHMRDDVMGVVDDLSSSLSPSSLLLSTAIIAHACRTTASEEYRSLIIYNSDDKDWPASRDNTYMAVVIGVLEHALLCSSFNEKEFYENVIALAALEETIGVREPRLACAQGYALALQNAVTKLLASKDTVDVKDMNNRVKEVERCISLILRLPSGDGRKARTTAFKRSLDALVGRNSNNGMQVIEESYPFLAQLLFINPENARSYIGPLKVEKFDKVIGSILMNADVSTSAAIFEEIFRSEVETLSKEVMFTVDESIERIKFIYSAIYVSMIELSIEESRRMNVDKVDALLKKTYNMSHHPIMNRVNGSVESAVKMISTKFGASILIELIKVFELSIQNGTGSSGSTGSSTSGWGGAIAQAKDPKFVEYLQKVQGMLLKEYTSSIKR